MKKALALALGATLAAGPAVPAAAAGHIDFSGYYRVMYMSETNSSHGKGSAGFTDDYFQDRLNIDLTFRPTDEIAVHWRLSGPGNAASRTSGSLANRGPGHYQRWGSGGDKGLYTNSIYGEITRGWGTVSVGRLADDLDVYGLASLGYQPATVPIYTNVGPFDRADFLDGVRYTRAWDNGFSLLAQYGKLSNDDITGGVIGDTAKNGHADQDWDQYRLEAAYAWDGGGAALGFFYDRNATRGTSETSDGEAIAGSGIPNFYVIRLNGHERGVALRKYEQWGLNPSIRHSWGDFSVHFEGLAQWGRVRYTSDNDNRGPNGKRLNSRPYDAEGFGAYLDFDYNYGPGNVTLAAWWVSGTDVDEMYTHEGVKSLKWKSRSIADLVGDNFYPLLVAYNGANSNPGENRYRGNAGRHVSAIGFANNAYENYVYKGQNISVFLNSDVRDVNSTVAELSSSTTGMNPGIRDTSLNSGTDANHWAIALTGNHAFTDDISMHYGLAYLALNEPNYRIATRGAWDANIGGRGAWTNFAYTEQDKDLGFEIDLGFTFQLLDNLKFTTAFGYMFNGDAYKEMKGYQVSTPNALGTGSTAWAVWADPDDSYVWFNSLTFSF